MTTSAADDGPSVEKALGCITSMLVPGETLEAWTIQRRLFALNHRRSLIAATSGRFIAITRGLFGGFNPTDIRWQDLKEARLSVGVFGAEITLTVEPISDQALPLGPTRSLTVTGLRKQHTQEVYRICQTHAQEWREKRRVRELEQMRARSGGIQFSSGGLPTQPPSDGGMQADTVKRLQQAKQMLEQKLISDSEYEAIKAKIVNAV